MSSTMLRTLASWQIRIGTGCFFPRTYFNNTANKSFMVLPTSFSLCRTAHIRFIYFNWPLSTNCIASWPYHCSTKLVQHVESCFVPIYSEHLLKLECRHPWSQRCNKESTPEPDMEWHLAFLHNGASSHPSVTPATLAAQHVPPILKTVRIS